MAKSENWLAPKLSEINNKAKRKKATDTARRKAAAPAGPKNAPRISDSGGKIDRLADTMNGGRGRVYLSPKRSKASTKATNEQMSRARRKDRGVVGKLSGVGRKTPPKPA